MSKEKNYTIGIHISGSQMKAILCDGERIIADSLLATPEDSIDHFLIMAKALIDPLLNKTNEDEAKLSGLGVGIAGIIDRVNNKIIKSSPNLPLLENIDLASLLQEKLNYPVRLDNSANCFLRAEIKLGAAKDLNNVFGLSLGDGIGGAWYLNNEIYSGSHLSAGEPGRMLIEFSQKIELEAAYQKICQGNPQKLAQEAYRADQLAERSFAELGEFLGMAAANIVNLIDPSAIIIGGTLTETADLFLPEMKKSLKKYIMSDEAKKIKILKSKLGEDASAIGASLLIE